MQVSASRWALYSRLLPVRVVRRQSTSVLAVENQDLAEAICQTNYDYFCVFTAASPETGAACGSITTTSTPR